MNEDVERSLESESFGEWGGCAVIDRKLLDCINLVMFERPINSAQKTNKWCLSDKQDHQLISRLVEYLSFTEVAHLFEMVC